MRVAAILRSMPSACTSTCGGWPGLAVRTSEKSPGRASSPLGRRKRSPWVRSENPPGSARYVARPEIAASVSGRLSSASCAVASRMRTSATISVSALSASVAQTRRLPTPLRSDSGTGRCERNPPRSVSRPSPKIVPEACQREALRASLRSARTSMRPERLAGGSAVSAA